MSYVRRIGKIYEQANEAPRHLRRLRAADAGSSGPAWLGDIASSIAAIERDGTDADREFAAREIARVLALTAFKIAQRRVVAELAGTNAILDRNVVTLPAKDFDRFLSEIEKPKPLADEAKKKLGLDPVWKDD